MITLYKPNETDFTHNGIGVLDKHIYSATVEEELNGLFVFNFNYPLFAPYGTKIDGMNIIKVPTPDGDQLFRVVTPKVSMGEIKAVCYHIFYDLTENLIEDIFIQPTNGSAAMARLSSGCQYKHLFTFYSDITNISTARIVRKNPVEAMLDTSQDNSFVNRWGGELKRDNFDVKMLKNRGANRGVVIRHKKDLLGYEGSVDWKSPTTRIMPQGFDGLLLPEKYVDSPLINKYPHPRIRVIEFNHIKAAIGKNANDEDAVPLEEAYKRLRQAAKDMFDIQMVDQPKATYKVEFQELSQTEEYKEYKILQRVWMGDIVTVKHEEDGIDIQAKVIAYKYDPIKKEYINVTIGNFKESFTDVTGKVDQIQQDLSNMPGSLLDAAKENATKLINSGFGGNVRVYPDRILIMDTKNEMTASKVWQWNINGLGYSSNGVNGPYEIAMTKDGRIVADFITTGVLNGNLIRGGEITGTTLRTANDSNYVSISKQFIRLMESYITRIFMGYYINNNNVMQPTIVLGGNNDITATQGAVLVYQLDGSPKSGGIGISNGYQNGDPTRVYFSASLAFNKNGHAELSSDQSLELESKESYASLKCQNNLFLESKAGGAYFTAKEGFNFRQNGDRIVDLKLTPGGDSDIVFQNILLRNNRNYESTYVQVKSGGGTYFNGVLAADFKVSSKKKYKTNIRDIKFDALEKVMGWEIKQYNLKTEMAQLYDMRMNRKEGDPLLTTNDITTHYGVVLPDESKENGVGLYGMIAQTVKAFQEYVAKTDARIEELEPIKPKGNIKHRNKVKRQRRPPRRVKRNS
ncbi:MULTISPECIES: phage tail spike protein [Bacillus cereus group]|uniref:phage tail spike protein n=1 Tax=Bacillus cereus group TaxID=86661 RepID=UPI00077A6DA0|nr:phage tail spike protein [Bacillus cereus]KXY95833.1 endopeptidase [Bacillus cereus]MCU5351839.1 phage tail protein [Bacillus cereus]MDK7408524.1 phage tail protein [Bacillus cereus]MDK7413966.1 phage tail protein [Bacillus cereus]MEC0007426.1 phage tail spike protein [Bacillus cereus]